MLKQTVQYEDFDGNQATETLYFNLTQTEVAMNMHLVERFEKLENKLDIKSGRRELKPQEIQEVVEAVQVLMELSYGIRLGPNDFEKEDDGTGRRPWSRFKSTAVYDTFMMGLFKNPEKANEFIMGVFPRELREEAAKQGLLPQAAGRPVNTTPDLAAVPDTDDTRPAWVRENREPTPEEFRAMTYDEFQEYHKQ